MVEKYLKRRDEGKQDGCLTKAASFVSTLFNYPNRQDGSSLTFLELSITQLGSGAVELFHFCSVHGHGQLHLMRLHNAQPKAEPLPPAQSMGEKVELVCSSVQRDAEITAAMANFHPEPRLKGDPFGTSSVSTTCSLGLVRSFFLLLFILTVQQKLSTDAFCS